MLNDVLGVKVRTESGRSLGRAHDLRADLSARTLSVTGVVVGQLGLLERIGFGAPGATARIRGEHVIPWSAVIRADRSGIVVRDDAG
jgi:sporulation protein YlmC with PRC-barrel domain